MNIFCQQSSCFDFRVEERSPTSANEPEAQEDLKPFKESPQRALDEALRCLANEQWDIKCSGLNSIRRLALFHPDAITALPAVMHQIDLAVLEEVKNLRSQVSRLAIITVAEMFASRARKAMEPVLTSSLICVLWDFLHGGCCRVSGS